MAVQLGRIDLYSALDDISQAEGLVVQLQRSPDHLSLLSTQVFMRLTTETMTPIAQKKLNNALALGLLGRCAPEDQQGFWKNRSVQEFFTSRARTPIPGPVQTPTTPPPQKHSWYPFLDKDGKSRFDELTGSSQVSSSKN